MLMLATNLSGAVQTYKAFGEHMYKIHPFSFYDSSTPDIFDFMTDHIN